MSWQDILYNILKSFSKFQLNDMLLEMLWEYYVHISLKDMSTNL